MTAFRHQSFLRQRVETPPLEEPIVQPDSYYDHQVSVRFHSEAAYLLAYLGVLLALMASWPAIIEVALPLLGAMK